MNDTSDTQRLADALATLAMNLADKLRAAEKGAGTEPAGLYPNRYTPIPPNGGRCEFTGLRHAKLYHLLQAGGPVRKRVRVANLRTPGAARGQTLFHVGDMLRYLDELAGARQAATG
jgi:hypothetical protein